MFEIKVNGVPLQLLQPVEDIKSLQISHHPFAELRIEARLRKPIGEWLYDLAQRCTGLITYQNVIIEKESINKLI